MRFLACFLAAIFAAKISNAVTIETVLIGNPGNPPDTRYDPTGIGSVGYDYRIGKYEITNAQYAEFLTAVAGFDRYGLFDPAQSLNAISGIVRSGRIGSYVYTVKPPAIGKGPGGSDYTYDDKPVVGINWNSAVRFANWMHNGMGSGDTETGAYTLSPGFPPPVSGYTIERNPGARWFLPNEDEWYKAAHFDADSGIYHDFYAGSNDQPNNNLPSADTGNSANFLVRFPPGQFPLGTTTGDLFYPLTNVGAYTLSPGPYGTFDQGGNVSEWTETLYDSQFRVLRGGYWFEVILSAQYKNYPSIVPAAKHAGVGFRLAALVPEPHALLLIGTAAPILIINRLNTTRRQR